MVSAGQRSCCSTRVARRAVVFPITISASIQRGCWRGRSRAMAQQQESCLLLCAERNRGTWKITFSMILPCFCNNCQELISWGPPLVDHNLLDEAWVPSGGWWEPALCGWSVWFSFFDTDAVDRTSYFPKEEHLARGCKEACLHSVNDLLL